MSMKVGRLAAEVKAWLLWRRDDHQRRNPSRRRARSATSCRGAICSSPRCILVHSLNGSECIGKRHRWPTLWQAVVEDDGHHSQTDDPPSHVCALVSFRPSVVGRIVAPPGAIRDGRCLPAFPFSLRQINVDRALIVTRGQRKPGGWQRILAPLRIMASLRDHGVAPSRRAAARSWRWCPIPDFRFARSDAFYMVGLHRVLSLTYFSAKIIMTSAPSTLART